MSYEILYDKQFIKLPEDKFIPIILTGSNNCTEMSMNGRERRARSWCTYHWLCPENNFLVTQDEMLKRMDEWRADIIQRNDVYDDSRFGYCSSLAIGGATHKTTFRKAKGVVTTGCRKALTVEQLGELNVHVTVSSLNSYYDKPKRIALNLDAYSKTVNSTEELLQVLNEDMKPYKEAKCYIGISIRADEYKMKRIRKHFFPRNPKRDKTKIEVEQFYTLRAENGSYFVKKTKWGYRYTHYPYLKYQTEKEAERRAKRSGGVVELVKEPTTLYV